MVDSTPNSKHGRHNLWPLEQFFRHDDRPEVQNPSPNRGPRWTGTGSWILDVGCWVWLLVAGLGKCYRLTQIHTHTRYGPTVNHTSANPRSPSPHHPNRLAGVTHNFNTNNKKKKEKQQRRRGAGVHQVQVAVANSVRVSWHLSDTQILRYSDTLILRYRYSSHWIINLRFELFETEKPVLAQSYKKVFPSAPL